MHSLTNSQFQGFVVKFSTSSITQTLHHLPHEAQSVPVTRSHVNGCHLKVAFNVESVKEKAIVLRNTIVLI